MKHSVQLQTNSTNNIVLQDKAIRNSIYVIYQYVPDAIMSDARGGQTELKVSEKTYLSPQFSNKW